MRCPNCHAENRDDSKFCSNCGPPRGADYGSMLRAEPRYQELRRKMNLPVVKK